MIDPKEMDAEGPVRTFSIVSAPHEPYLMFATRMRDSAFKRALKNAPAEMELAWDGPYGSFILHHNPAKPAIFLAGGIGVTPFMSMVKHAAHDKLPHHIYLFHSNHKPEDAPFLTDLKEFDEQNPNIHYIPTMTDLEPHHAWNGETGIIDWNLIARNVPKAQEPIYYLAGPAEFVTAMRDMLKNSGADEDSIRFEEFAGY